jgi:hypothetical protein
MMGELVIDPGEVERLAEEREDENWDFRAASISRIHNTFICPIVFNVVEEMKYALRWPRRNRWRR